MRTEFAWMYGLEADHKHIYHYKEVKDYDHIFLIFPKGKTFLSSEGSRILNGVNPVSELLASDFINLLRLNNKKIHYVQEGPHWWWNDYEVSDQINFYNLLSQCDSIFAHNQHDVPYYKGLFPNKEVNVIPTLMIENRVSTMVPKRKEKVIIGGNFARWYGGFESYIVASRFELPIYAQTSHAKRDGEELMDNLTHLPRLMWDDWMVALKDFKYAVHLMPTVAAGTFSLNCAYFGIPCIGNIDVDTQLNCHPRLSVNCNNVEEAAELAVELKNNPEFYESCSREAKENYRKFYDLSVWQNKMTSVLK
jgi:hypothetical protein